MRPPVMVFTDFDGTMTERDTLVAIAAAFLEPAVREALDRRFEAEAELRLWELIDASLVGCERSLDEAIAHALAHVPFDPGFAPFSAALARAGVPLTIVSAGVHELIAAYLAREGLTSLPIRANRARPLPTGGFGLTPEDPTCPTGVDKALILKEAKAAGHLTIFIGDGLSDRLAVAEADVVFAKAGLARYCAQRGVPHTPFSSFAELWEPISALLGAAAR